MSYAKLFKARCTLADSVVGSNKCQSDTEAINDFRGMENSWAVPTHLLQSEGVANDLSDTIASDFPLESERKLDVFEYVATNWAVHTYDNSCSYNRQGLASTSSHKTVTSNLQAIILYQAARAEFVSSSTDTLHYGKISDRREREDDCFPIKIVRITISAYRIRQNRQVEKRMAYVYVF
ncbi:hypothetical protein AVEN_161345-1 [Araneus ventricosus]|uniref:Uncharacterized protein n=1 Tax=Araneus ventricosus TaxID=182803 RepID=A0A4Y1ZW32_ARAVE|nr:hypothetical protein AVEN_98924-1 [Araneus ventricosus]GBL71281.1 hypothetical protein AVEN_70289-1 [Araneus ventricosus]GBL71405.1 hypothetical protein AVEN_161345-1 [Araneus ventricosus]